MPMFCDSEVWAEDALLGAILIEATDGTRTAITQVRQLVQARDLTGDLRPLIYRAMLDCDGPPDAVIVACQMQAIDPRIGGPELGYLYHCLAECPTSLHYLRYARLVAEAGAKRRGEPVKPRYRGGVSL